MINDPEIGILYEDGDIVAVNKPSGLMVHGDGRAKLRFLTDWIVEKYPETVNVGEPARDLKGEKIERHGIVHRLDRETSGALLVAKTQAGFDCLKKQFQDRVIKKKYLAYIWGDLKEEFGTINRPIGRSVTDFRKWSAQRGARGELRDAETYWTKLKNLNGRTEEQKCEPFTLVEVEPKTGRTHQIRVHFSAIQHAVVGDQLYAPKKPRALGFARTALHAVSIEFTNTAGTLVKVKAPLPDDFGLVNERFLC
ncbi:MAG: RluA family pseudouridine synthase [Candidatus Paceibacterota bacterium]